MKKEIMNKANEREMALREVVMDWVMKDLDAVKTEMIATLMKYEPDDWEEVTPTRETAYDILPMWGTMWSFTCKLDNEWLEGNLQTMADCGFRIYHSEKFGYFFGVDGAGYNFYSPHWIPLYKARGFRCDEEEAK